MGHGGRLGHIGQFVSRRTAVLEKQLKKLALVEQVGDLPDGKHRNERDEHHDDLSPDFRTLRRDFLEARGEILTVNETLDEVLEHSKTNTRRLKLNVL